MHDYDPEEERHRRQAQCDEDDERAHGPGVSCATQ